MLTKKCISWMHPLRSVFDLLLGTKYVWVSFHPAKVANLNLSNIDLTGVLVGLRNQLTVKISRVVADLHVILYDVQSSMPI